MRNPVPLPPSLPLFLFVVLGVGCVGTTRRPSAPDVEGKDVRARHGIVVSASPPASRVGRDVLREGGNAVDAAVATALALAVTLPEAGNLGGGGFMLVRPPGRDAEPVVIDYRETAPAAATRDMFARPNAPSSHRLVGTPGTVRGLWLAHRQFGKLPWARLVAPAVRLAEGGFEVDDDLARSLNAALDRAAGFDEFRRVYGKRAAPDGTRPNWHPGDRLVQPDLARTLRLIADGGESAFYTGDVARQTAATVREGGGILTEADLSDYQAELRRPVHGTYRGYDVYAPPPPTSGGIALVEMLNILETFDLRAAGRWSPRTLHLMVEAMRQAYFDRARYLGDADFVPPRPELTDKAYAGRLAASIDPARATQSDALAAAAGVTVAPAAEGEHTTHFGVVDSGGMAVANTYTLEQAYGGMLVVKGYGFLLNNEMGDFNPRPGITDRTGRIGTPPNQVEPGKRMLSSMTPTIVTRHGRVVLVTGSPGGRTIINTVLCVVLNALEFGMPPHEAVAAPRLHHQWLPDGIRVEAALAGEHRESLEALRAMGHDIDAAPAKQGDAQSVFGHEDGSYTGISDPRRGDDAAGW